MQVHNLQIGEDARCDRHDGNDNNFDEMVGSHERFSDVKKEEVDLPEEA